MLNTYLSPRGLLRAVFFILLLFCLQACEKALNLKLTAAPVVAGDIFDKMPSLELPYNLYMPSSMVGWEFSHFTQFNFDSAHQVYVLDNIPIDKPLQDDGGARFKLCSNAWRYQFGFGDNISDTESTFGVPPEGVVLQVEQFKGPTSDLRFEVPPPPKSFVENGSPSTSRVMRVEFKLISVTPTPHGLLRVTIH